MEIIYQKNGIFNLKTKQNSISIGPILSKNLISTNSNLIIYTEHQYPYQNNDLIEDYKGEIIRSPGEYEIGGITILGIQLDRKETPKEVSLKTAMRVKIDDIIFAYLGFLEDYNETILYDQLGDIDVLFLPIEKTLFEQSNKIIKKIEPSIIIPFSINDKSSDLQLFCKERGLQTLNPINSLSLIKSDIIPEEEKIVLFQ